MKKRICLLLTLIISLFVFSGRVEAAKELTCICEDTYFGGGTHIMIVQNSNGEHFAYTNSRGKATIDDSEWYYPKDDFIVKFNFEGATQYSNGVLNSCPEYGRYEFTSKTSGSFYTFYLYNNKLTFKADHACVQYDGLPDLDVYSSFTSDKIDEYNEIIENNEWSGQCEYYATDDEDRITLYFNEDRYLMVNESNLIYSSTAKFTLKQLWDIVNEYNTCPVRLYEVSPLINANLTRDFWMEYYLDNSKGGREYLCTGPTCKNHIGPIKPEKPDIIIDDCASLFGDELVEKINDFMDIFKIAVPILLIGFGIVDFTKAVFSSKEDDMTKSKKTFFKRIIAAILVFIAPIFINLILSLANEVWGNITPDTCIKQGK